MAAFDYARMALTAEALITRFGATVTFPRTTGGTEPDPVTGEFVEPTPAPVDTIGLLKPYPASLIDGSRILSTDRMLILTDAVEPLMTDTPQMNGSTLGSIVEIKTSKPTDTTLVYFCQIRV